MTRQRQGGKEEKGYLSKFILQSVSTIVSKTRRRASQGLTEEKKRERKKNKLQRKETVMTEGKEDKLLAAAASFDHSLIFGDKATN